MKFFAVYQEFDTGFSGHAETRIELLLVWAEDEQAALASVKANWESEPPDYGYGYSYEVQAVDLTEGAEPQQVYYWDNR